MISTRFGGRFLRHWQVLIPLVLAFGCTSDSYRHARSTGDSRLVGRVDENQYITPTGQILTPAGRQIELPGLRPQAQAISPDGRMLATSGKTGVLVLIDLATGRPMQRATLATNKVEAVNQAENEKSLEDPAAAPDTQPAAATTNKVNSLMSFTGLVFSPDGARIYVSTAGGDVRAFPVGTNHFVGTPVAIAVPDARAPKQRKEIPTGLAVSPDSKRLYVVGNLGNRLHEIDAQTRKVLRSWNTGVAPYDVLLAGTKAYVSNLGGRRPTTNDVTAPAGKGTKVRVDPVRFIPDEGSVTVIDLAAGTVAAEIMVELHPSAMAISPDKKYLVVANAGSDTLSVIDIKSDTVIEKIWTRPSPADLFGAQPNALAFDRSGRRIYVCNGTQNAVAVIQFEPEDNASKAIGFIPVGWFPGAVLVDARHNTLCVANIKGLGALKISKPGEKVKLATKDFFGAVSIVPVPTARELAGMTDVVMRNMRYPKIEEAKLSPRPNQPARPVPERAGEPSVIKHVIYIIKENRTYDQVLGDVLTGNGDTNLCTFGEKFTPNQHKIVREFVLLDNTYCSGVQSADGHQWTDSAIANEYVERQLTSGFPRSYPGGKAEDGVDALAWASSGFIWNNALEHGKTFRNFGEWMISDAGWTDKKAHKEKPKWQDYWDDYQNGSNQTRLASHAGLESLRKHSPTNTIGWDLNVPDVARAAEFIKALKEFEAEGTFPDLVMMLLPNDHTGGTRGKVPTPGAQVADNDLALGRIVEAVSHSKFWPETCLFVIEDDPQAGWDHVSGYRTTCYVVSPYTKRRQTVSTQYNHTSLMRTMELILGLPPMNQLDASATPMSDCFTGVADLTPFISVPNRVRLDEINPEPKKIANAILRRDALASARMQFDEPDRCPEDVLNQILWRAMKGPNEPYPRWAVKSVDDDD